MGGGHVKLGKLAGVQVAAWDRADGDSGKMRRTAPNLKRKTRLPADATLSCWTADTRLCWTRNALASGGTDGREQV